MRFRTRALIGIAIAALLALLPAVALADWLIFPTPHSPNGSREYDLYLFVTVPAIIVFVLVEAALVYTAFRYLRRRAYVMPRQLHGNTRLEIIWTVIPAIIIAIISIKAGLVLASDNQPGNFPNPPDAVQVNVTGIQWVWEYSYPKQGITSGGTPEGIMDVPVNTVVRLAFNSPDVIHGWWVPSLVGKTDAVPGYTNYNWFQADTIGVFKGGCTEFCGLNHAEMHVTVNVLSAGDFQAWVAGCRSGNVKGCGPIKS
jgi:cytochrome c oxidase subunit 2